MDTRLFLEILRIDSTSGQEAELADYLAERLLTPKCRLERFGDNLLFCWGDPQVVFCTHLDTVPPYIPPTISHHAEPLPHHYEALQTLSHNYEALESHSHNCEDPGFIKRHYEDPDFIRRHCEDPGGRRGNLPPTTAERYSQHHVEPTPSDSHVEQTERDETSIYGRGTCDAKGQIAAMYEACLTLESKGYDGFGLLLLYGEETGSYGAKAFRDQHPGAEWLVVGEPTDNCMASASKGTKAFEVTFTGKSFHSGYPQYGQSAVEHFNDFMNALRSIGFPKDGLLGDTTFNVGRLVSDNPQNILSDRLTCRVYFRTTFESDEMVGNVMKNMAGPQARLRFGRPRVQDGSDIVAKDVAPWQKAMSVEALGGDSPTRYEVLDGFPSKPVAFGSDAPQLTNFRRKILCGPGSILVAHRDDEHITLSALEHAVDNYIRIYEHIICLPRPEWQP